MRYFEIREKYGIVQQELLTLEMEYKDKIKGEAYQKRKFQLINKLDDLKRKAREIGTNGNICHVRGKRSRPHIKNPRILIDERFNLYFVNVTEEEASALVSLHVSNIVQYTLTFIRPGKIITTS